MSRTPSLLCPHLCWLVSATLLQSSSLKLQCQTQGSAAYDGSLPEAPLLSPLLGWCLPSCSNFCFAIACGCVWHGLLFSLLCVEAHPVPTQMIFLRCQKETIFSKWNLALEMIFWNGGEHVCADALVSWEVTSDQREQALGRHYSFNHIFLSALLMPLWSEVLVLNSYYGFEGYTPTPPFHPPIWSWSQFWMSSCFKSMVVGLPAGLIAWWTISNNCQNEEKRTASISLACLG